MGSSSGGAGNLTGQATPDAPFGPSQGQDPSQLRNQLASLLGSGGGGGRIGLPGDPAIAAAIAQNMRQQGGPQRTMFGVPSGVGGAPGSGGGSPPPATITPAMARVYQGLSGGGDGGGRLPPSMPASRAGGGLMGSMGSMPSGRAIPPGGAMPPNLPPVDPSSIMRAMPGGGGTAMMNDAQYARSLDPNALKPGALGPAGPVFGTNTPQSGSNPAPATVTPAMARAYRGSGG